MEKGGWIPVLKQRGSKGGWRKEANARLFTIFVDDLPRSMTLKMLGEIFRKFGVVKDVYILLKRRRVSNTRFAFVRYDCEMAAEVAVQKANGIWVDDKKLAVKHADYGKKDMEVKTRYRPQIIGFPHVEGVRAVCGSQ
ncbi:serine/arginine-rich splicing factor 8-like [Camellia sinensis]|uniref:serine/arginine-rich splicing factor 8-like n=1 Tax=Camellia sinensis TaxID=4442 RepID=UPI0010367D59|nr:serine/arginine-rich splicing factor 8-like [Camellia sinensis]